MENTIHTQESTTAASLFAAHEMTPREIVTELDRFIIGQEAAKRAIAVAVRNRVRRQRLPESLRHEVVPKNVMMSGPTGVGKTEIARRLAKLIDAPFTKVEATRYTEVGYYGRDVESMVRDLVTDGIRIIKRRQRQTLEAAAAAAAEEKLLDLLMPSTYSNPSAKTTETAGPSFLNPTFYAMETADSTTNSTDLASTSTSASTTSAQSTSHATGESDDAEARRLRSREKLRAILRTGVLDGKKVQLAVEKKASMPAMMVGGVGMDGLEENLEKMFGKMMPSRPVQREVTVSDARKILIEQEVETRLDPDKVNAEAIELSENLGIIFIDEIDKIADSGKTQGADVSRQGVQRDLLPIVEGSTVQTKYGSVKTDHILFIAAGAFHKVTPADLMPELQGRFPIRVELSELSEDDLYRILTEPSASLLKQYVGMFATEHVELIFEESAIRLMAAHAWERNRVQQNIGARRLVTILERVLEEANFSAPEMGAGRIVVNEAYVRQRLEAVLADDDVSRFIL